MFDNLLFKMEMMSEGRMIKKENKMLKRRTKRATKDSRYQDAINSRERYHYDTYSKMNETRKHNETTGIFGKLYKGCDDLRRKIGFVE